MTILFITSRYPYPLLKGDQVRAHHQIRELAKRGHKIVLVTFDNGQRNPDFEKLCHAVYLVKPTGRVSILGQLVRLLFTSQPLQLAFFHSPDMTKTLQEALGQHDSDVAVLQLSRMGHYLQQLQAYKLPTLLDLIDSLAMNIDLKAKKAAFPMNLLWWLEAKRLHRYELNAVASVAAATVVSQKDKDYLAHEAIYVNPNGVRIETLQQQKRDSKTLLFHGNMSYYPNIEAAKFLVKQIMPLVWQHAPECKVLLVGASPSKDVTALASERVRVTGFVEDVKPFLASATLGVYPISRATGIQNKILEAMMQGLPVVTTPTVAEGIQQGRAGQHFCQAETAEATAKSILKLLADSCERKKLAEAGRELVLEHYTWEKTVRALEALLALASKPQGSLAD